MKKNNLSIALSLCTSVGIVGCGGGDGDSNSLDTQAPSVSYSVTAIDGYLKGAEVWLDLNGNFQLDAGEPTAITGDGGKASLNVADIDTPEQYSLVVRSIKGQTVDEDTGNTVASDYVMSAPAGQQDVTPLSTLVHVQLESGQVSNLDAAVRNVAAELGIEETGVLGDYKEDNNQEAAFGARSIVAAGVLPETTDDLNTAANDSDGTNELLDTIAVVTEKIKTVIGDDTKVLDDIVFNKNGEADVDSDKDGVADSDDAFSNDDSEWLDTDSDGTGDNADLDDDNDGVSDETDDFPYDNAESIDTDGDGTGNNADLDDDNDGVLDENDDLPLNKDESVDTDGDGTGNNADLDDDNDGVSDETDDFPYDNAESIDTDGDGTGNNADLDDDNDGVPDETDDFPYDNAESIDTDGDGTGNNADLDDDNDGVPDDVDIDPVDPNVGLSDIAKVIQFMRDSNTFYTFWGDSSESIEQLFQETFSVNGDTAPLTALHRINSEGTLITLDLDEGFDYQLTESGWTEIPEKYTFDFSNDELIAYPTSFPTIKYTVTASLKELSGLNIFNNSFGLEFIENESVLYPEGSTSAELTFTPQNDAYYLWTDWAPWVLRGEGQDSGPNGRSLDEIQVGSSIGDVAGVNAFVGASIGYDATVELLTDNTANFYTMDWPGDTATKIASATWTLKTLHGQEFILFTVPDQAIQSWGDKFDQDSPHVIFSIFNNTLHMGSLEKAGIPEGETSTFLNTTAKDAFLDNAEIPISKCSVNSNDDGTATLEEFEVAIAACGGATPITAEMVIGQNFHRVKGNGETRDYFFNADGTMSGLGNEADPWEIKGDYLVVNYQDGGHWYWSLLEHNDETWSLKFYEIDMTSGEEQNIIWEDTVQLNNTQPCQLLDGAGYSYAEYLESIKACGGQLPDVAEQDIMEQTYSRFKSNGESRSYYFKSDYTAIDYRNGLPRERFWEFNNDGLLVVYYDQGKAEVAEHIAFTAKSGSELDFTFYVSDEGEQEVWTSTYEEVVTNSIVECNTANTDWDDVSDMPLTTAPIADYHSAVSLCKDSGEGSANFSTEYFDRNIAFTSISTGENDGFETYQFFPLVDGQASGTGKYLTADDNMDMTWSVDNATNLITITLTDGVNTGTDTLAITSSNGVEFSLKGFSRATDWDGIEDSSEGDIWSHVFTSTSFE